jgi:hypothetical protein
MMEINVTYNGIFGKPCFINQEASQAEEAENERYQNLSR